MQIVDISLTDRSYHLLLYQALLFYNLSGAIENLLRFSEKK